MIHMSRFRTAETPDHQNWRAQVSGMSEGAYYMSLKGHARQFVKRIGYVPFPGTLNAKLEEREFVESSQQFDLGGTMWWGPTGG